ncbi:MAG: YihA family ribosome biogenesis GTP-binding protein [Clostridia bacterium]|nr:YihA family ribosome biogenesis GTP-binding protein [Clostridia bacterium]
MINWQNASFETSCGAPSQLFASDLPEIAFSGKSNVGKSSLINKLLNRKALAKTGAEPGKTRTVNFFNIDSQLRFVDLPGYGYAKVSKEIKEKWMRLMDAFWSSERDTRLVIQLIDLRNGPSADDMMMLDFLNHYGYEYVVAATKADKLSKSQRAENAEKLRALKQLEGKTVIEFSTREDAGKTALLELITERVK